MFNTRETLSHYELQEYYKELAIEKIKTNVSENIPDHLAWLLGHCIAHTHFDVEGCGSIVADKCQLCDLELAALLDDDEIFKKKYQEYQYDQATMYAE
jgi:hypothetical protein